MNTSGLVLDVNDDGGEQLKQSFTRDGSDLPGFIKQAYDARLADPSALPDDVFALVLLNGDEKLRKYACTGGESTALSVLYFLKNAHKLPDEARVRAAENLKVASGWYGLDVPEELEKEALTANHLLTAVAAPSLIKGTRDGIRDNMARVHAGEAAAGVQGGLASQGHGMIHTAGVDFDDEVLADAFKVADVTGTSLAPVSKDSKESDDAGPEHTIKKTSSLGRLVPGHRGESSVEPEVAAGVAGKNPSKSPQHMNPVVDVTGKEPRKESIEKKASRYALPSYGRYPIDSYEQVKTASQYFGDYCEQMPPVDRHEYCVNLTKRANELGIQLSDKVRKYGSEKYASAEELTAALEMRRSLLEPQAVAVLNKVASVMAATEPEAFASLLGEFDRYACLDRHYDSSIFDPYYSTFGFQKTASEDPDNWSDVVGNYHITGNQLLTFAKSQHVRLHKQFGEEFAKEFKDDPIGIYNSMPSEQKTLIIRMATENSPA